MGGAKNPDRLSKGCGIEVCTRIIVSTQASCDFESCMPCMWPPVLVCRQAMAGATFVWKEGRLAGKSPKTKNNHIKHVAREGFEQLDIVIAINFDLGFSQQI